jgi:glycosyltransferase involved in cell wall biosynthesis
MNTQRILWLTSWYPSRVAPVNGDFIQRHARAAARFHPIDVLHLVRDDSAKMQQVTETTLHEFPNLTERIMYYKAAKHPSLLQRYFENLRFFRLFRQMIAAYIRQHGSPACVHVHIPVKAGLLALWMKKKYKIKFAVTEHWGIYNEVVDDRYDVRSFFFKRALRLVLQHAAAFMPVSDYLGRGINKMVTEKKYQVIPNVADTKYFNYHEHPPRDKFRFIHVSNMVPLKNVEGILRAVKTLSERRTDFELVLVGSATPELEQLAASLGMLETVVFFRREIPYDAVAYEMQQSDTLVLFSNIENMPCVIAEALCCGLPCIATQVGGIPEMVNAGNGILVPAGGETELVRAMEQMLHNIGSYNRKKIAEQAQHLFSYDTIGKQFSEVYQSISKPG